MRGASNGVLLQHATVERPLAMPRSHGGKQHRFVGEETTVVPSNRIRSVEDMLGNSALAAWQPGSNGCHGELFCQLLRLAKDDECHVIWFGRQPAYAADHAFVYGVAQCCCGVRQGTFADAFDEFVHVKVVENPITGK